ncbi:hypothetical protein CL619_04020 [archaeon]|jgi:phosphoribosylformylglycinamidine (FGAM) synthase PurS component|nr:hypothetical protein [archaeon]|tara:strand:+ start:1125 stop:1580 length:456 start_codon:yes stop_codon:yes gene_type:complete
MNELELFVSLKVPDNVAITAFHTLHKLGYHNLKNLERSDYYKFKFSGDKNQFQKKISKVDILVNANKHKFSFNLETDNQDKKTSVLVQDINHNQNLLKTLKERLDFKNLRNVEKGILWTMYFGGNANAKAIATDITKSLLMNENYQKYKII